MNDSPSCSNILLRACYAQYIANTIEPMFIIIIGIICLGTGRKKGEGVVFRLELTITFDYKLLWVGLVLVCWWWGGGLRFKTNKINL